MLATRLRAEGRRIVVVHEPGGTELGEYLRAWLKDGARPLTPEAELLLFAAARTEVVRRVIAPALADGVTVIADRYADSTRVYQGSGRGIATRHVKAALRIATGGLEPSLTILLDLDPREAQARAATRDASSVRRRFEDAGLGFHRRIRRAFLRLAAADPVRWRVVSAELPEAAVAEAVWNAVRERLTP